MKCKKKWYKLKNGYWLKILLIKADPRYWGYTDKTFFVDIAVGKTKRIVNNHYSKTCHSPKSLRNKSSNNKGGIEALLITLQYIQEIEQSLPKNSIIRIEGSNEQRINVYSRLKKYGFIEAFWNAPKCHWHKKKYYFKEII